MLSFEGHSKKLKNKIDDYNLKLISHNGSGFDSYVVLNNLPQWRSVVNLNEIGAGNVSLNFFNGYVYENRKNTQYVHFRCGRVHINNSLKKLGNMYKL